MIEKSEIAAVISERKLIEDTLRKEKAFTEGVLNALQDVFYVFDIKADF